MALFRDLIRTIAHAEGLSEMTVTGIGQYLRDAGLISKHGRGRAAAQMTSLDATNLIIGVNASDLAKNSVQAVKIFSKLVIGRDAYSEIADNNTSVAFERGVTFARAIQIIIDAHIPKFDEPSWVDRIIPPDSYKIEIGFGRPIKAGFVKISEEMPPSISNPFNVDGLKKPIAFGHFWSGSTLWSQENGRKDLTIIGSKTLSMVGTILAI